MSLAQTRRMCSQRPRCCLSEKPLRPHPYDPVPGHLNERTKLKRPGSIHVVMDSERSVVQMKLVHGPRLA
jgi:hypothetical protein